MDVKQILAFILDPKLLAIAGGYAGYHFLGKGKEGYKPYAYAAGGIAAGYLAGRLAQSFVNPAVPAPALAPVVAAGTPQHQLANSTMDMLDFDDTPVPQRALPPHVPTRNEDLFETARRQATKIAQAPAPPAPEHVDVRDESADDADLLHSLGAYEGSGEDGLGSYDPSLDGDVDVAQALRDAGMDRKPSN